MAKEKKAEKGELQIQRPAHWLSPLERMEELFEDLYRRPFGRHLIPGFPGIFEKGELSPSVDIYEENGNIVLKAELPGMDKKDIDVNLTNRSVTISGEKKREEKTEKKDYYRYESSCGSFSRSFTLPAEIQADKAKASFKDGVLKITIPKTEEAKKKEKKLDIE
ncbi:MAG: Hsp20/alpha crystallin family protein [Nitrospirae bacterium]|nr:Hsp20/alpha crystallin family protein [Nitrospirota bacterium]